MHDYIVIPTDEAHPELWARADALTEQRTRKRLGLSVDEPLPGSIKNKPIDLFDASRAFDWSARETRR